MVLLAIFFLVIILLILLLIPLAKHFFDTYNQIDQKKVELYRESDSFVLQQQFSQQMEARWKQISDQYADSTKQHQHQSENEVILIFLQDYMQSILKVFK